MYKIPELEEIRKRIDSLDNNIHDLLMERADLIDKISAAKKKAGVQIVQPAREAKMIRRLLSRHQGALPKEAVVGIWRELVGAVCMMQTGLRYAVFAPPQSPEYADMARDYFGSVLPMSRTETVDSAISMLRKNMVNFAVLPWPEMVEESDWWACMIDDNCYDLNILVSLPYCSNISDGHIGKALVVAKDMKFSSSDYDNSFIGIETSSDFSRSGIMEKIQQCGLTPVSIYATDGKNKETRKFMVEIEGHIESEDKKIEMIKSVLKTKENENILKVRSLGGYPIPPSYETE